MKIAFHSIHFSPFFGGTARLDDVLDATAAAGFHHVGLDEWSIEAHIAGSGTLTSVRESLDARHLDCTDVVVIAVDRDREAVLASAHRMARIADVVGNSLCGLAVIEEQDRAETTSVVRECASILSDQGVRLAVEFTPYSALATLRDAYDVCDAVGWDRAGIMLDALHVARAHTPWNQIRSLDASQIAIVQFCDASAVPETDLVHDSRSCRRVPGDGELPLEQFVGVVRATGFDGIVAAEVLSDEIRDSDPGTVTSRMYAALAAFWPEGG